MEYNLPLNSPIDLDALDDYLMSDHAPDDSMGLSDLDGFLTGVVVGPELIPPSEWLPVVWGGAEPEFETQEEMRTVLGTIMGRYNEIAACFNSDPDEFDPIFWEGPEGEVIASDWAGGFLDAVALRAQAWRPLIGDDRAGILLAPLFLLNGDLEFEDGAADEDELLAEASDMIPTCIVGIHEFWRKLSEPAVTADDAAGQEAADASDTQLVSTASMVDQVGKAIAKADGACFESSASLPKVGIGGAEAADPPTEAMVDAAHKAVWSDAFWAINSRADFKRAVRAMIRAAMAR